MTKPIPDPMVAQPPVKALNEVKEDVVMKDEETKQPAPVKETPVSEQISSIEDEWRKLKIQNQILNTDFRRTDVDATLKFQDLPLPFESDGSLQFFWIDAQEELGGAEIFLFGKIWQPE